MKKRAPFKPPLGTPKQEAERCRRAFYFCGTPKEMRSFAKRILELVPPYDEALKAEAHS